MRAFIGKKKPEIVSTCSNVNFILCVFMSRVFVTVMRTAHWVIMSGFVTLKKQFVLFCASVSSVLKRLSSLAILQAMQNNIKRVVVNYFIWNSKMNAVNFSMNKISEIHWNSFSKLNLLYVDISNNQLVHINIKTSVYIALLSLSRNSGFLVSPMSLNKMNVRNIKTDKYELCCFARMNTLCTATIPCQGILPTTNLKIAYLFVFFAIISTSGFSIALQKTSHKPKYQTSAANVVNVVVATLVDIFIDST